MSDTLNDLLKAAVIRGEPREIRRLVAAGADVSAPTLLLKAVELGHRRAVGNLIGAGAPLYQHFIMFCGAAIRKRHTRVLRLLLDNATVDRPADPEASLTRAAVSTGDAKILALLIEEGFPLDRTAVVASSWRGDLEILELLLAAGADPRATEGHSGYALGRAVQRGHVAFVKRLLRAGVGGEGIEALDTAVRLNRLEMAEILLAGGVPLDPTGHAPEWLMIAASHANTEMLQLLMRYGADVNTPGQTSLRYRPEVKQGERTPLDMAMTGGNWRTVAFLRNAGAVIPERMLSRGLRRYRPEVQVALLSSGPLPVDAAAFARFGICTEGLLTVLRRSGPEQSALADFLSATCALDGLGPDARADLLERLLASANQALETEQRGAMPDA